MSVTDPQPEQEQPEVQPEAPEAAAPAEEPAVEESAPVEPADPTIAQSVDPLNQAPVVAPAPPPVGPVVEPIVSPEAVAPEPAQVQTKVSLVNGQTVQVPGVSADDFAEALKDGFYKLESGLRLAVAHIVSFE